jgi:hypothetical protein
MKPLNVNHPMLRRVRRKEPGVRDSIGRSVPRPGRVSSGSAESADKSPAVHVPWLRGIDHARDGVTTTDHSGSEAWWYDSRRKR